MARGGAWWPSLRTADGSFDYTVFVRRDEQSTVPAATVDLEAGVRYALARAAEGLVGAAGTQHCVHRRVGELDRLYAPDEPDEQFDSVAEHCRAVPVPLSNLIRVPAAS